MKFFSCIAVPDSTFHRNSVHRHAVISGLVMLIITLSLLQGGCSSMQLWFGWRVKLDEIPVSSISATMTGGTGIAPGFTSELIVSVKRPNGEVLLTEGAGKGKVRWRDLAITSTVVKVDNHGVITLPDDPRKSEDKTGHIVITVPSHPDVRTEFDIPVQYNVNFTADFSGAHGRNGNNGADGTDGMMGSMGSMDPNNPAPGGMGGNGTDGADGEDGQRGGDALPVVVVMTLYETEQQPLLQVLVANRTGRKLFLVDPDGGSLTVLADGGQGGYGGRGGSGGHGGAGGAGVPVGARGVDGMNGHDGFAGTEGKGGRINVIYDPRVLPYFQAIHFSSHNGPAPTFKLRHIGPLW